MITCRNLTHYYGKRLIYENLSFDVPKGRILGLLGKNGTGKTTTINILSGFLKPYAGECRIFGEEVQSMKPTTRREIGMLMEGHVQYTFMNIEQIERFYAAFYPKWNREVYYELMKKLTSVSLACLADSVHKWLWDLFLPKIRNCSFSTTFLWALTLAIVGCLLTICAILPKVKTKRFFSPHISFRIWNG